jgi:HSP20 family protein
MKSSIPFSALNLRLALAKGLCDHAEMRPRIQAVVIPSESSEFAEEVDRLLKEIGRSAGSFLTAECSPPLDVYETDDGFHIAMDLPGVDLSAVRVIAKGNAVLIAGEKIPRRGRGDSSFHLVERSYGRFARVARLTKPCDSSRARATLIDGELRVWLPKIADRRGRTTTIQVSGERPVA